MTKGAEDMTKDAKDTTAVANSSTNIRTLSWMASLSLAAGELRAAEGYLLELLAWCAFGKRTDEIAVEK